MFDGRDQLLMASGLEHRVSLVDELLAEQQRPGTAVMKFSEWHDEKHESPLQARYYSKLIPVSKPQRGEQYAFEVNLDQCTGCKACVAACHSLNGLDDHESWRDIGALTGTKEEPYLQTVTTACHHCVDPACASGCPVLAYDKDEETGIVRHLDDQCIGCSYCILKCPYDVPKYNAKRGIVRKCDMCQQRLAVGEAPACVQSCPSEAISIRIVSVAETVEVSESPDVSLLPGAFESSYTLPTTRYVSEKHMPLSAHSSTAGDLHLEEAHRPLAWMLVITQMAGGLFVASALTGSTAAMTLLNAVGFVVHSVGLLISVMHLGQPLRAWRAFLGWRRSWLSREIMAFGGFAKVAALAAVWPWMEGWIQTHSPVNIPVTLPMLTWVAAGAGVVGVLCSAMVYVDTRRTFWRGSMTFPKFVGTMLLLGASAGGALAAWLPSGLVVAKIFAMAALVIHAVLLGWEASVLRASYGDEAGSWHRSALLMVKLCPDLLRTRLWLFGAFVVGTLGVLVGPSAIVVWCSALALAAAFASQAIERRLFFVACAAPRMPGVPPPPAHH